jgi:hypothetical protein
MNSRFWKYCDCCSKAIYIGDDIWKIDGAIFCDRCVRGGVAGEDGEL